MTWEIQISSFLHGELHPLVCKFFLYFLKAHEFIEVIGRLKLQLLNVNGRLAFGR